MPNSVGDFYLGEPAFFLISVQNISNPKVTLTNVRTVIQTDSRNVPRSDAHDSTYEKPLQHNEFMTVCVRIDCRSAEEIQVLFICTIRTKLTKYTILTFEIMAWHVSIGRPFKSLNFAQISVSKYNLNRK